VSAGGPTERLREFFVQVNAVLSDPATQGRPLERLEHIRRLVRELADMRGAAADALGAAWESRTTVEREEFVGLFAEVLERGYVARFAGAVRGNGQVAPVYTGEALRETEATVTTRLRSGGGELHVDYRMVLRDGRWRVRDVVLDGVSTVGNYRAQFKRLAQDGGHAKVVGHMRAKLAADSLLFARADVRPVPPASPTPPAAAAGPPPSPAPPPASSVVVAAPAVSPSRVASAPASAPIARPARPVVPPPARPVAAPAVSAPALSSPPAVVTAAVPVPPRVLVPSPRPVEAPVPSLASVDGSPSPVDQAARLLMTVALAAWITAVWRRWRAGTR
jgi:phospholipid transport system substrate-binding protein